MASLDHQVHQGHQATEAKMETKDNQVREEIMDSLVQQAHEVHLDVTDSQDQLEKVVLR